MNILGLNSKYSMPSYNRKDSELHPLNDGSIALLNDGQIVFCSIEERNTRRRYSGGFNESLSRYVDYLQKPLSLDVIAFSSCCGPRWESERDVEEELTCLLNKEERLLIESKPRIVIVDHHDSHASLGFALSGFKKAIIAVIDGFGNLLDSNNWNPQKWWQGKFERNSYYIGEWVNGRFYLEKIDADACGDDDVSLGELYSAITHYCGWDSYQHAGTTMALAAFGDTSAFKDLRFIDYSNETIKVLLPNNHDNIASYFSQYLLDNKIDISPLAGRNCNQSDTRHCHIIAKIQDELTQALKVRLLKLAERNNIDSIVVAGGVALNCLAMGSIAQSVNVRLSIPPAPGDTGQALGNALWAAYCIDSPCPEQSPLEILQAPFWGIPNAEKTLMEALRILALDPKIIILDKQTIKSQSEYAAKALSEGKIVATCLGKSEYGPRALGGRSILADPRYMESKIKVNAFKKREQFRPFAPAILKEKMNDYFDCSIDSPFMSFALPFKKEVVKLIPAVVHADGTARVQTVESTSSSPLRSILEFFDKITNVPILLNTSFNEKGEPIVETPLDAASAFIKSDLDVLLLDNHIILHKKGE